MTWGSRRQIIAVKNTSGEEIPPFAAMELSYTSGSCVTVVDDETYWEVKKPTSVAASDPTKIVFNGPSHIPIGKTGEATIDLVALVLLSDPGAVLSVGDSVGPVASSWYLAGGSSGWRLKSRDYATTPAFTVSSDVKSVYVERSSGRLALVMKSGGSGIAARSGTTISSGTCTVWGRSGSTLSATSRTEDVYNLSESAPVGNTVHIIAIETNIGWVTNWEDC